jgi:hypothetical protein
MVAMTSPFTGSYVVDTDYFGFADLRRILDLIGAVWARPTCAASSA